MWIRAVAGVVALLLSGCGPRNDDPGPDPGPGYPLNLAAVLQNHRDAMDKGDTSQILKDYDDASIVRVRTEDADAGNPISKTYTGKTEIADFFMNLFEDVKNFVVAVEKQPDEQKVLVKAWFLCWRSPEEGYEAVSETFVFADSLKIRMQHIAITRSPGRLSASQENPVQVARFDPPTSIADAVAKHKAALNNVPQKNGAGFIPAAAFVNLYLPEKPATIYELNWDATPTLKEWEGANGQGDYYQALSTNLDSEPALAGYSFGFLANELDASSAFLQWSNKEWLSAANTLVYDKDYRILFHTIAKRAVARQGTTAVTVTV